jgi:V-type H+-transporting ATPase subunit A
LIQVIITFYDLCQKSIADSPADAKLTYAHIKTALSPIIQKVVDTKYVDPKAPAPEINKQYGVIIDEMKNEFTKLTDGI